MKILRGYFSAPSRNASKSNYMLSYARFPSLFLFLWYQPSINSIEEFKSARKKKKKKGTKKKIGQGTYLHTYFSHLLLITLSRAWNYETSWINTWRKDVNITVCQFFWYLRWDVTYLVSYSAISDAGERGPTSSSRGVKNMYIF